MRISIYLDSVTGIGQAYNKSFHENLESLQCFISYNWRNKMCFKGKTLPRTRFRISLAQVFVSQTLYFLQDFSPRYLYELLPYQTTSHNAILSRNIPPFHFKHNFFKNPFFSFWNNLMQQCRLINSKFRKFEYFWKKYQDALPTVHIYVSVSRVLNILQGYVLV